jgi:transposase InsO family protein
MSSAAKASRSSRTPFCAPQANAFAERWVGTVRRDCLDWLLITSRRQLERVLRVYVDHYNTHRPEGCQNYVHSGRGSVVLVHEAAEAIVAADVAAGRLFDL